MGPLKDLPRRYDWLSPFACASQRTLTGRCRYESSGARSRELGAFIWAVFPSRQCAHPGSRWIDCTTFEDGRDDTSSRKSPISNP